MLQLDVFLKLSPMALVQKSVFSKMRSWSSPRVKDETEGMELLPIFCLFCRRVIYP